MHSMDVSSGDASKPVAVGISSGDLDAYHAFDNARTASVASSHKPVSEAGMFSSIFNLSNTILGASTLSIAYACRYTGAGLFAVLLCLFGFLANFSIQLLTRSLVYTNRETYGDIGYEALGRMGEMLALGCVILQQLGACIAYVDVIGDVLHPIVDKIGVNIVDTREFWQIATLVLVIFPLTMLKKMDSLRISSLVAVFLILTFAVVVTIDGISSANSNHLALEIANDSVRIVPNNPLKMLQVIPIICFAFVCHMNVFPIYQELKDRTVGRMDKVGAFSILICFVVYILTGLFGYIGFRDAVQSDLLDTYDVTHILVPDVIVRIVQCGIGIALIFSFPVLAFELRHCVDAVFFPHAEFSWIRHSLENVAIIAISLTVGILVPTVTTVFGFVGATTSTLIVFVMPPLFYLKIERRNRGNEVVAQTGACSRHMRRTIAWGELIMGVLLIPTCLTALTLQQVEG